MHIRKPVVAGMFYPGDASSLKRVLDTLARPFEDRTPEANPCLVMMPHAGYVYSGPTMAATLAGVSLPDRLVILCPNHTGRGRALGVWPDGSWETPLGSLPVDADFAADLCGRGYFEADLASHVREHSIEVLLPFVQRLRPDNPPAIVPVCVGIQTAGVLQGAGDILAQALQAAKGSTGIVVSSDMNHYESEQVTQAKDKRALDCIVAEDPESLLRCCRADHITMCGAGPMALALFALRRLRGGKPASRAPRVVMHDTSGRAARDFTRVVGYAGVHVYA